MTQVKGTIVDISTGKILRSVSALTQEILDMQVQPGEKLIDGYYQGRDFFYQNGEFIPVTDMDIPDVLETLEAVTIDIPNPAMVSVEGRRDKSGKITTGRLTLDSPVNARGYSVDIRGHHKFRTKTFRVMWPALELERAEALEQLETDIAVRARGLAGDYSPIEQVGFAAK